MDPELKQKINNLTDKAGVYFFKNAAEQVIYVGKAKNLKKRVKNHFQKPDQHAFDFISQIADIDFIQTGSEKEALLLEQQFIKKLQPRWNTDWKDDKNYFYVALSNDNFPRAHLTHQPNLAGVGNLRNSGSPQARRFPTPANSTPFGPFVSGREVKSFLREIRKTLPYRTCRNLSKKPCFYRDLALCLAPCANMDKKTKSAYPEMMAILRVLLRIYQGKGVCRGLTSNAKFVEVKPQQTKMRVECYDVSNLAGTLAVGSMAVFENGKANKNEYRKFKIKTIEGQNDVASLREVLSRRFKHSEWAKPDLIILDGGKGQLKAAKNINISTVALAKIGDKDGKLFTKFSKNYAQLSKLPPNLSNLFLQIRDEAHRFAIIYNKHRRLQMIKIIKTKKT